MNKELITGSFQRMKSTNLSIVLNLIRQKGPISRADMAKLTRLTPPTISNLTKELLHRELIIEQSLGESSGGRKPTLLTLNSERHHLIGVDIGSHELNIIITNLEGETKHSIVQTIPSPVTKERLLALLIKSIHILIDAAREPEKLIGIGVAMHGIVDVSKGESIFAPNLDLHHLPIKNILEEEFGLMVIVENDARAIAHGHQWFNHEKSSLNLACINVGRGIGAGLIIDGELYLGHDFISGEIGHMAIDLQGPICSCGNNGCLQTFATGPAIAEKMRMRLSQGETSMLSKMMADSTDDDLTGEHVFEAAKAGDRLAQQILREAGEYLGIGLTNLIHIINPEKIVLSGGVIQAGEFLLESVQNTIQKRALTEKAKQTEITVSTFGRHATVMGAVSLLLRKLFSNFGS
ncbi:ROK family transcriptional regulator [Pradoshia sp.]